MPGSRSRISEFSILSSAFLGCCVIIVFSWHLLARFTPFGLDELDREHMLVALEQAERGLELGEAPVGAVVAIDGKEVASAHNEVLRSGKLTAHAEVLAVERALDSLGQQHFHADPREITVYSTYEPCPMCEGFMLWTGVDRVVWGQEKSTNYLLNQYLLPKFRYWIYSRGGLEAERSEALFEAKKAGN